MNFLFLDDNAERTKTVRRHHPYGVYVETAQQCIDAIQKRDIWEIVLLDHDLGNETFVNSGRSDCGMEVVRWICDNKPDIKVILVHSLNMPASLEMVIKLQECGYDRVYQAPFINIQWDIFDPEKMVSVGNKRRHFAP